MLFGLGMILLLIPCINIVAAWFLAADTAKLFGKELGWAILLFIFPGIGLGTGEDEFEEHGRVCFRPRQGDDAVGEKVVGPETECAHHAEVTGDIGNEIFGPFVVAQVVAEQCAIDFAKVAGGKLAEALGEFVRIEKFPARCLGQLEALGLADFAERAEEAVAEGFFRVTENIEAADPRDGGEGREQE